MRQGRNLVAHTRDDTQCPNCRALLFARPRAFPVIDKDLLMAVRRRNWDLMRTLAAAGARYSARIEEGDSNGHNSMGMQPLHYAVRDHAPPAVVREIYLGHPKALWEREACGLTPYGLLDPNDSTNAPATSEADFQEVRAAAPSATARGEQGGECLHRPDHRTPR